MNPLYRFSYAISFDDVDAAQIVYYPRYFHLCHLAFEDFFNRKGFMTYADMINQRRVGFPTVHIEADYKKPLRYGDKITIEMTVAAIKGSSMVMTYRFIEDGAGETNFIATITTVHIDMALKRATTIADDLRRLFSGEHVE